MWLCSNETLFTIADSRLDLMYSRLLTPSLSDASDEDGILREGCFCASHAWVSQSIHTPWFQQKRNMKKKLFNEGVPKAEIGLCQPWGPCCLTQSVRWAENIGSSFGWAMSCHHDALKARVLPWWLSGKESACQSLIWECPTCGGATKPMGPNYWGCALEPRSHNYASLCT